MADLTIAIKVPEYVVAKMADDLDQFDYGAAAMQERLLELLSQAVSDYDEQRERVKFCAKQAKRSAKRYADAKLARKRYAAGV